MGESEYQCQSKPCLTIDTTKSTTTSTIISTSLIMTTSTADISPETTTEKLFCPNMKMDVKVRNGINNELVSNAFVTVINLPNKKSKDEKEEGEEDGFKDSYDVAEEGDFLMAKTQVTEEGEAVALVSSNGLFLVKVEASGFITFERELDLDCNPSDCDACLEDLNIFVPLSPMMEDDISVRFSLSWGEKPQDLDLHSYRKSWKDSTECETWYSHKKCDLMVLDLDNTKGGDNGAETITLKKDESQLDKIMMISVHLYKGTHQEFKDSNPHFFITGIYIFKYMSR